MEIIPDSVVKIGKDSLLFLLTISLFSNRLNISEVTSGKMGTANE
jgi:hypothetical protein